ncbi:MAG: hypothetical protein CFE26_13325 [Verrucomicrobiales bacterium VVV1]|nr:MAG: hypothetical protein CFE26_13325 [Verrucomicrobiales bacterium VVV1]
MAQLGDIREVLQYIPQFRGRTFLVLIEAGLLPEPAVAETLLDLAALEDLGVKLVLGGRGGDLKDLYDWTLECEIMAARVKSPISDPASIAETREILARGQSAVVDASATGPLDPAVVDYALGLGVSKVIALLEEAILIEGQPVHAIRATEADELAANGADIEGRSLLEAASQACARGVPRVHVLNGRRQGVLVDELFSNEGVGTMIHAARTYEDILAKIGDYSVISIDDNVVGCVALHEHPDEQSAEIACLYVKQAHEGRGYGVELVHHAEKLAESRHIPKVFALTNRAADFFRERLGYTLGTPEDLPLVRRNQYIASGRDSLVFFKSLNA